MPKYNKNFIADVIFRMDFDTIESLSANNQPVEFEQLIESNFPTKEPLKQIGLKFQNQGEEIETEKVNSTVWTYKNPDKGLNVELTSEFLVINCKKYEDYNTLESEITFVLDKFFEHFQITQINRLGLRYIDRILLTEDDLFNWEQFINPSLIGNLNFIDNKESVRRVMQAYELSLDNDTYLNFKAGVFNSWYPNKLLQKEFFIDCDCYTPIKFEHTEVTNKLKSFHTICSEYFEKSITENFRNEVLNND